MITDEIHVIGILEENEETGYITINDLRSLMCDYLQLMPYYKELLVTLNIEEARALIEFEKIELHDIFKTMTLKSFLTAIPPYYQNRVTKYTIKLIRAALVTYCRGLLTMNDLREGASVHQVKEFENLTIGVPCDVETIHSILWIIRRTINNVILTKWINVHAKFLEKPGTLMVQEFIYLLCNCVSKEEMYQKIPKIQMNVKMDKKVKIFQVDSEFPKTYMTPDYKMQHMMGSLYPPEKIVIEGIANPNPLAFKQSNKANKGQNNKNDNDKDDGPDAFRKKLRSMVLTVGIKVKLKEYHQKLIRSRLNGRNAYDKLIFKGETGLPKPLEVNNDNVLLKRNSSHAKSASNFNTYRPQSAAVQQNNSNANSIFGHRKIVPRSALSKSKSGSLPPNKSINDEELMKSDTVDVFHMTSKTFRPTTGNASARKMPKRTGSLDMSAQNPKHQVELKSRNQIDSYLNLVQKDLNMVNMFENMAGKELRRFQNTNKSMQENTQRKLDEKAYFNTQVVSPVITRILSAKTGSPIIPGSPVNSRRLGSARAKFN